MGDTQMSIFQTICSKWYSKGKYPWIFNLSGKQGTLEMSAFVELLHSNTAGTMLDVTAQMNRVQHLWYNGFTVVELHE
jgi:hypothetical protein